MKTGIPGCALLLVASFAVTVNCGTDPRPACPLQSTTSLSPISLKDANSVQTYGLIPASYNPAVPARWVLYNHGLGQDGLDISILPHDSCLASALVQAGYVVIASNYRNQNCWGNSQCVADIAAVQELWKAHLNLRPSPYVIAESMGGIVTWNAITHKTLAPLAVAGIYPACNLANMYAAGTGPFYSDIQTDYDFSNPDNYATATAGYDRMLAPASEFTKFPIVMWASDSDTSVVRSQNEDPFAARVNAAGGNAIIVPTSGNHGNASNFNPPGVVALFDSH